LDVEGMTCGACAARVERVLGRQEGVALAEVNFATGRARVAAGPSVTLADLQAAVDRIGYGVAEHVPVTSAPSVAAGRGADEVTRWQRRAVVALPLAGIVVLLAMTPVGDLLPMTTRAWTIAGLASVVQF